MARYGIDSMHALFGGEVQSKKGGWRLIAIPKFLAVARAMGKSLSAALKRPISKRTQ